MQQTHKIAFCSVFAGSTVYGLTMRVDCDGYEECEQEQEERADVEKESVSHRTCEKEPWTWFKKCS